MLLLDCEFCAAGMCTARGLSATRGSSQLQANLLSRETSSTALKCTAQHTPQLEGSSPQGVQHTGCSFPLTPFPFLYRCSGCSVSRSSGQHTAGWHCHGPTLSQLPGPPNSGSPESRGPCAQSGVSISPWPWLRQQKFIMLRLLLLLLLLLSPLFNKHCSPKTEIWAHDYF